MAQEGQKVGHYRLISVLSSGGMGEVYRAEDLQIPRQVAIKVIRIKGAIRQGAIQDALAFLSVKLKQSLIYNTRIFYLSSSMYNLDEHLNGKLTRNLANATPPHYLTLPQTPSLFSNTLPISVVKIHYHMRFFLISLD